MISGETRSKKKFRENENGWEAKKLFQLKRRILKCFGEFDVVTIQAIVEGVQGRVAYVRRFHFIEKR